MATPTKVARACAKDQGGGLFLCFRADLRELHESPRIVQQSSPVSRLLQIEHKRRGDAFDIDASALNGYPGLAIAAD